MQFYLNKVLYKEFSHLINNGSIAFNRNADGSKCLNDNETTVQLGRYIWFYSAYYNEFKYENSKDLALTIYEHTLNEYKTDNGGYKISANNDNYHVYFNAFMLYGITELYMATGEVSILSNIEQLVSFIESNFYNNDLNLYSEQLDKNCNIVSNTELPVCGEYIYTSNSLIHILEAYTNLVKATGKYHELLRKVLDMLVKYFYNEDGFFATLISSKKMQYTREKSYAHDIETVWLLIEAIQTLELDINKYNLKLVNICKNVATYAVDSSGFVQTSNLNDRTYWWAQVEAVVGFYYADKYLGYDNSLFLKINKFNIDYIYKENGTLNCLDRSLNSCDLPLAYCWKTPYHDGRMMLKMYKEMEKIWII